MHRWGDPNSHSHSHNHHPGQSVRQRRHESARGYEAFSEQAPGYDEDSYRLSSSAASESDDDESEGSCIWKLTFSDSVYDDALLRPLVGRGHQDKCHRVITPISIAFMLFFNLCLQCLVLWKIAYVSNEERERGGPLFEACNLRPNGFMPFLTRRPGMQGEYVDCSPLMVAMMSNVSNLDADKDGWWTVDEAARLGPEWSTTYGKRHDLPTVFENFMERAEKGELLAQQGVAASSADTLNFTRIPMAWMHKQQGELQMCANFNPSLCGNLEVRGILANILQYLGKDAPKTASSRIKKCKKLVDQCEDMFGQLFMWYEQVAYEACGTRDSGLSNTSIVTTRYANPIKFALQRDAIARMSYATFLCVIVTIWLLVVIHEARQVLCWWLVIIFYPTPSSPSAKVIAKDDDGNLDVLAMPTCHKVLQIVFNLFPRTVICVFLAYFGCDFLIFADDYGDLILNSVALGFLIDIDNMIFRGVITERNQTNVAECAPMKVKFNCWPPCVCCFAAVPQAMFLMTLIICISITKIWWSYHEGKGKYEMADAYTCLCHAEGEKCVAAQILGGLFNLPEGAFGEFLIN